MVEFEQNLWGGGTSRFKLVIFCILVAFCEMFTFATGVYAGKGEGPCLTSDSSQVTMHRLYNPNSGEHFYTSNAEEKDNLVSLGWQYEGPGWTAPSTGDPVYRLYNPNAGDHHYTLNVKERNDLIALGWNNEGIGWYSASKTDGVPLYRQYNPNAKAGSHNYTTSQKENNDLVNLGWNAEGVAWYGMK